MRHIQIILIFLLLLLFASSALAQTATPSPEPTAADIPGALVQAQDAAATAQAAVARIEEAADRVDGGVDFAFNLLGLFEAIGFFVTVAAGIGAVIGITRLFSAQSELSAARKRFEEEVDAASKRLETETKQKEAELSTFRAELKRDTSNATLALSYLPLAEGQYKSGDFLGALDILNRALTLDNNNPIIHYRMGYVYTQSGRLPEAENHLKQALIIDKDFAPALAVLGYTYRRLGEKMPVGIDRDKILNEAEKLLLQALTLAPRLVDEEGESWWGSLGGLYRRRGQVDQAIYAYTQAGDVVPNSSYAFSNLALLHMQQDNREKMIDTYKQVEKLAMAEVQADVDNYWAYADLLTARLALNKLTDAEKTIDSIYITAPVDSPYPLESLMDTLGRLAKVLEREQATHVLDYIERIRRYAEEQARKREEARAREDARTAQPAPGD